MAASDALIVGEDWISEHYFTTDAKSESFQAKVAERRKAWDEDAKSGADDRPLAVHRRPRPAWGRRSPTCSPASRASVTTACPSCTPSCARCSATTAASTR